jgi:hypothetical protein
MRTQILHTLAQLAVAVALSGMAQAATISETLTGTIASGIDTQNNFGGGDLTEDAFTFSFIYDTGLLTNDAVLGTDGSFYLTYGPGSEYYDDLAADGAVSESFSINSHNFSLTNNFAGGVGFVEGCTTPAPSCGPGYLEVLVQGGPNNAYIEFSLYSSLTYSIGQILSQSAVSAFLASLTQASIEVSDGQTFDTFYLGNVTATSAAPEPGTWVSLALGFGAVGLLRRTNFCQKAV